MGRALGSKGERAVARAAASGAKRGKGTRGDWLYRIDVVDLLENLELENIKQATGDELVCSCPFPGHIHGDRKPSLYINDGSKDKSKATVWKCHGCGRSGNAVSLVAGIDNSTKQKAAQHLRERYAPDWRAPKGGSITAEVTAWARERAENAHARHVVVDQPVIPWERYHKLFGVDWTIAQESKHAAVQYLPQRGLALSTLEEWGIGYDTSSDRLTIPVVNEGGDLVGVKARAWEEGRKPKYMILGDRPGRKKRYRFKHYEKSLVVFGADKVIDAGASSAVFCEGELDVIALSQFDIPAICTGSAHLSDEQSRIIRDSLDEVVVFFDSDNAGDNATWGWFDEDGDYHPGLVAKLDPFIRVRVVRRHWFDPAKMVEQGNVDPLRRMIASAELARRCRKCAMIPPGNHFAAA